MIEKMQMVHIVTSVSKKDEMLQSLRAVGVVHIAEQKSADRDIIERVQSLTKTATTLKDYEPDKKSKAKGSKPEILSDEKFEELYARVLEAIEQKAKSIQDISAANTEIDRIQAWGNFSPSELNELKAAGFDFHFYRLSKKDFETISEDPDIKFIRLAQIDKMDTVAVLGTLPVTIPATEFTVPDKSISDYKQIISDNNALIAKAEESLRNDSVYGDSFNAQILKAEEQEKYSAASATVEGDKDFVWISGYVPAVDVDKVKQMASQNNCAWAVDDVADDDEQIPTKVRYNKVSKLIEPVFNLLGILPGYREQDISLWFFLFFVLFFAMIIGDAGYGFLILGGTLALAAKSRKMNNTLFLLLVLSIATIVWGAITGTWFGIEGAMNVPFLKALVIPNFANYPEYFGVTATAQQNTIMKFSFSVGAIQMALGSLLCIKKKISEKNLSWVADLGWMIAIVAMYLLSLYLVIGDEVPIVAVFVAIGVAFLLVVLFGGMSPEKTFGQGLKSGVADAFTVFLNTISCFGNVMSYIRLFAVGMAGLAIAQSFNQIAAGFEGVLVVAGIVVIVIGHGLNIIMAFLSVVVHGIRLNVLEFSGQVGLEWTGIPYEPFKENIKVNNSEKEN